MTCERQLQCILKNHLVAQLQQNFPEHFKKDLETVVDLVFDAMISALKEKRRIEIRNIGSLSLHKQKGREFVNPKTDKVMICPSNYRIVFKAGKDLRSND